MQRADFANLRNTGGAHTAPERGPPYTGRSSSSVSCETPQRVTEILAPVQPRGDGGDQIVPVDGLTSNLPLGVVVAVPTDLYSAHSIGDRQRSPRTRCVSNAGQTETGNLEQISSPDSGSLVARRPDAATRLLSPRVFGMIMIGTGLAPLLLGAIDHRRSTRLLNEEFGISHRSTAIVVAGS